MSKVNELIDGATSTIHQAAGDLFEETIGQILEEINDDPMGFLFSLMDNNSMTQFFSIETAHMANNFQTLVSAANTLEDIEFLEKEEGMSDMACVDPYDMPPDLTLVEDK